MIRQRLFGLLMLSVALVAMSILFSGIGLAAPPAQTEAGPGEVYVVKAGDSLYKISGIVYNEPGAWPEIVSATNAKAAEDSSFAMIRDPRRIFVGQKLWLPLREGQAAAPMAAASGAPRVLFKQPLSGATVAPTFMVEMAAEGLTVEPAGAIRPDAGHMHILVDTDFVPAGEVILVDEQHLHFGKGQLTTTLALEPGLHTLRLQFANGAHIALEGEQYQDTITVTVGEE